MMSIILYGQEDLMLPEIIFLIHLVLGYVACLLCFSVYALPKLKSMSRFEAQRVIATVHSFRFFGLVFILPGVVGPNLPAGFAAFAAYGDFATGVLAILALLTVRIRPLFWLFVVAFNLVGTSDLFVAYYHAIRLGLPALAGQLGAAYAIPILYVPMLMITHFVAFYFMKEKNNKERNNA
jgi:phosphoglycerol transferase MdoB-like AlkP superfamily enzyme